MMARVSEAVLWGESGLRALPVRMSTVLADVPMETKLHPPSLRAEWVERRELIATLARDAVKLVLIDAPAGSGKTTLVASWLASTMEDRRYAWVSLDRGDDDPARLWTHIVHSLQRACPELDGRKIERALRAQPADIAETALPILVNELASLPSAVILVLDDYHLIKEPSCHDQTAFLLLHLPPSAEIVLITRADPPLPVARLRAAGEMVEIRMRELRFGPSEAAALVRNVSGAELSEPDLAVLLERTEGWPAGLYLSALSLRDHSSPSAFIRQFSGDNRFIVDFLTEEVLGRQPGKIREFLARTAVLGRFCAPLCDAVAGSADAAEIIDVLERENLFLVPLDDKRQWYRYHHLFAQVLRSQLARTEPDIVPTLHERASAWHRRSGSTDEAMGHALAAGDLAGAADLIAGHWFAYVDSGRAATLRKWMRSLGDDQIAAHPLAAHSAAWVAALSGEPESARRWVHVVRAGQHEGPLPDGMPSLAFSAALLDGTFGFDGILAMRESAARAVALGRDLMSPWHALALTALGFSLYLSGEPGATEALREAILSEASVPLVRTMALSCAALVATEERRLALAQELAAAARQVADRGNLSQTPQNSLAHAASGAVLAQEGRLEEARSELQRALQSRRRWPGLSPWPTLETLLRLAPVLFDMGDRPGAAALLGEARAILTRLPEGAEAQLARLERLERRIATRRPRAISLADPLTEREEAVLRLLRGTLSLREIGQVLHLSQNTIKTHTRAIYRKLGVSTRHDAVEKSREIGIA